HHHVADRLRVELRVALDECLQRDRRQIVGPNGFERPLDGPADGRSDGVDDYGFGHVRLSPWSMAGAGSVRECAARAAPILWEAAKWDRVRGRGGSRPARRSQRGGPARGEAFV